MTSTFRLGFYYFSMSAMALFLGSLSMFSEDSIMSRLSSIPAIEGFYIMFYIA